ncbi:GNAT family N-acetyltransferase [Janthinobacterium sp. Ant5-2-1]|uniref:GNAT family N-acetyltransferase n=1 Tax=Janthinobacterium sp. Ant5-2-1 TaxID=1755239 RepID=UPI00071806D7|nr:GNAT family N-acetyltransferase [Janthinobacterium sp. Ant5-2-1]
MPHLNISSDKAELDVPAIHHFLSTQSTWAIGIQLATVQRAIEHSLCVGGYIDGRQMAFARVVSDYATFAYLVDVYVLEEYRGRGYSKRLMEAVMEHPDLQGLRRFMLATSTAHDLYGRYGFTAPLRPGTLMERYFPDIYQR